MLGYNLTYIFLHSVERISNRDMKLTVHGITTAIKRKRLILIIGMKYEVILLCYETEKRQSVY